MPIYQVALTVSSSFSTFYQASLFHILMAAAVCLCVYVCAFMQVSQPTSHLLKMYK